MLLGVDTGGTFTDFVVLENGRLRFHKELSTPDDPFRAIARGIAQLGLDADGLHLVHGSTVATNAILECKGARVLFVTNEGFEDMLAIGRQSRQALYDLRPASRHHLLPDGTLGIRGRIGANGEEVQKLDASGLEVLAKRAGAYDAVAVCLLFSFLNPAHEKRIGECLDGKVTFSSLSHEVMAEHREYERASTTFLNAYVGPLVRHYLERIRDHLAPRHFFIMHSGGGVMDADLASRQAVKLVLSGPAGGIVAAEAVCRQLGLGKALTFDMGGTSTDVSLIDGAPARITSGQMAGMPVAVPMMDIHTIGAGGGSIAWIDDAGLPRLGPESAGADPGPACYGRGGSLPTVTDAHVVLGRIPAQIRLGGHMPLDIGAAMGALKAFGHSLGLDVWQAAKAVIDLANEHMLGALRVVSVQKGHDPSEFALICFGGAGGLHACDLAELLGCQSIVLPLACGAFSALGMIVGKRQADFSLSRRIALYDTHAKERLLEVFDSLKERARGQLPGLKLDYHLQCDIGYVGQGFHLTVPFGGETDAMVRQFLSLHEQLYGHLLDRDVEVVTMRLTAIAETPTLQWPASDICNGLSRPVAYSEVVGCCRVPHYRRDQLGWRTCVEGPALILEDTSTFWLKAGWCLEVVEHGHIMIKRGKR